MALEAATSEAGIGQVLEGRSCERVALGQIAVPTSPPLVRGWAPGRPTVHPKERTRSRRIARRSGDGDHGELKGFEGVVVVGGALAHRRPGLGVRLQVVGGGGLGVRPRGNPAGDRQHPVQPGPRRSLRRHRARARRRVHGYRRRRSPALRSGTLRRASTGRYRRSGCREGAG